MRWPMMGKISMPAGHHPAATCGRQSPGSSPALAGGVITNFRDEDCVELSQALRLLRARHLVLVASLRERVVGELLAQAPVSPAATLDIASAHLHAQAREDAFARLSVRDSLMVDAEPAMLGVELVNRYHAARRAGMI